LVIENAPDAVDVSRSEGRPSTSCVVQKPEKYDDPCGVVVVTDASFS